jgi:hypothetical protein
MKAPVTIHTLHMWTKDNYFRTSNTSMRSLVIENIKYNFISYQRSQKVQQYRDIKVIFHMLNLKIFMADHSQLSHAKDLQDLRRECK